MITQLRFKYTKFFILHIMCVLLGKYKEYKTFPKSFCDLVHMTAILPFFSVPCLMLLNVQVPDLHITPKITNTDLEARCHQTTDQSIQLVKFRLFWLPLFLLQCSTSPTELKANFSLTLSV